MAHEQRLIDLLRRRLPEAQLSLHSNGRLAKSKAAVLNSYDRACLSLASFDPATCKRLTGVEQVLDLERIMALATIPIKVSILVTELNRPELPAMIDRCRALGIRRMVLRRPWGSESNRPLLADHQPQRRFGGNPVYQLDGLEVTVWDFARAACLRCLNLFADGSISDRYELVSGTARR